MALQYYVHFFYINHVHYSVCNRFHRILNGLAIIYFDLAGQCIKLFSSNFKQNCQFATKGDEEYMREHFHFSSLRRRDNHFFLIFSFFLRFWPEINFGFSSDGIRSDF